MSSETELYFQQHDRKQKRDKEYEEKPERKKKQKVRADPKGVEDRGRGQCQRTHLPIENGCSHNTRITSENEKRSRRKLNSIL
jgi:hypothetical protein